jgi:peptidoglycan/xylan/chitin deacetylase (PgdA/CDA1 family)
MISRLLLRRSVAHGPLALMYHGIDSPGDLSNSPWSLPRRAFAAHLRMLRDEGYTGHTIDALPAGQPGRHVAITFDDGYRNNLVAAEALEAAGYSGTFFVVSGSLGGAPCWRDDDGPRDAIMDAAALRELSARGFEIGSHGDRHERLTHLSAAQARSSLEISRQVLGEIIERPIVSLAYPYGDWNAEILACAEHAGYRNACTTQSGWALRDGDRLRIRRLSVMREDTPARLARKLAVAANAVEWVTLWQNRLGLQGAKR